jgi:hypothetical protein
MTAMIREVYDALKAINVPEDKAAAAAQAVAALGMGQAIEGRMTTIEQHMTRLEGRLLLVQWMLGFNLGATLLVLITLVSKAL